MVCSREIHLEGALVAAVLLSACAPADTRSSTRLVVQEHALRDAPTTEPWGFRPVEGPMEAVLAMHAAERADRIPDESEMITGEHAIRVRLGSDELVATEHHGGDPASGWVSLDRNGAEIYRVDTGMPSPLSGLQGLWAYDDHWVLETTYVQPEAYSGRLSMDGMQLAPNGNRQEAFDFQMLDGTPFYFFRQNSRIGIS
jgi:hypothetical protein